MLATLLLQKQGSPSKQEFQKLKEIVEAEYITELDIGV